MCLLGKYFTIELYPQLHDHCILVFTGLAVIIIPINLGAIANYCFLKNFVFWNSYRLMDVTKTVQRYLCPITQFSLTTFYVTIVYISKLALVLVFAHFTFICVYSSVTFITSVDLYIHHCSWIRNCSILSTTSSYPTLTVTNLISVSTDVFTRMLSKWNHAVCRFWRLSFHLSVATLDAPSVFYFSVNSFQLYGCPRFCLCIHSLKLLGSFPFGPLLIKNTNLCLYIALYT